MKKIILHSDDLGITEQSTRDIIDSWVNGDISSFSIIANGDAVQKIPIYLTTFANLNARIAVHFNLTEGFPSASPKDVSLLLGKDGRFNQSFGKLVAKTFFSFPMRRLQLKQQIYLECRAQIAAVKNICAGRDVVAIDSHNHIHMIPRVFSIVATAAKDEKIEEIRISKEPFFLSDNFFHILKPFWIVNLVKNILLKLFSAHAVKVANNLALKSPIAFIGLLYSGRMTAENALSGIRAVNDSGHIEVTFHVGKSLPHEGSRWCNSSYSEFHLSPKRTLEKMEVRRLAQLLSFHKQSLED